MSHLAKYPLLSKVIATAQLDGDREVDFLRANEAAWSAEAAAVASDPEALREIVTAEIARGTGTADAFCEWLEHFDFCSGFSNDSRKISRAIFGAYLKNGDGARRAAALAQINERTASYFFAAGRWLDADVLTQLLSPVTLVDWILARRKAYGEDGAVFDLWRLVHELTDAVPAYAFECAGIFATNADPEARFFRIDLLGGLRFRAEIGEGLVSMLGLALETMRIDSNPEVRADYWRTLKRPLELGRLPDDCLNRALSEATDGLPEENAVGYEFAIAATRESVPQRQTVQCFQWLAQQLKQRRAPERQYQVATAVAMGLERMTPTVLGFDPVDLLLRIQPVDKSHRGIWRQIQTALYPLSRTAIPRLHRFLQLCARDHWSTLKTVLERGGELAGTLSALSQHRAESAAFAAELATAKTPGERRLGFHLIESLQLPPAATGQGTFTRDEFVTWLAEFRLAIIYQSIAQQLIVAAARLDLADQAMVADFQREVLYQCKNLPGLCLERLKTQAADVEVFKQPTADAEAYFAALAKLANSPLKAQQMPGLGQARRRKHARDAQDIDRSVDAHSIFAQFVKPSYLLYGTRWATYHGGKLGAEQTLQTTSVSTEFPRKSLFNPEEYVGRRLSAIIQLQSKPSPAPEPPA